MQVWSDHPDWVEEERELSDLRARRLTPCGIWDNRFEVASRDICRYHGRVPDVLIRDVPAEDIARIDAHAARLGLSRTEYLRRRLRQDAARPVGPVTAVDLQRFSSRFAALGDPEVMRRAWS
jgi:hypothetical protein